MKPYLYYTILAAAVVGIAFLAFKDNSSSFPIENPKVSMNNPLQSTSAPPVNENNEPPSANDPSPRPPQNSLPAQVVRTVATDQKVVVLTFDAGSDRGFAGQILDTLKAEDIKASFGMTGKWADQNPDIVKRITAEGHDFINHTYSHDSFTGFSTQNPAMSQAERFEELNRTENIIKNLTGKTTLPYFRPPYGDYDESVNRDIAQAGYRYNIMWTVDSLGWKGLSVQEIHDRVVDGTVPGAIHLFHVGAQSQDVAALPMIIDSLRNQGYSFARISDLLE